LETFTGEGIFAADKADSSMSSNEEEEGQSSFWDGIIEVEH
jgi:hypothetical protein